MAQTPTTKPAFFTYKAEVISIKEPCPDHKIIRFKLLEPETIDFLPGQFVQVIVEEFAKPASFSIASSPADKGEVELAFHRVGRVTGVMDKMLVGTKATLRGAMGRFTYSAEDGDVIALAGGIGVTPFISAMRFISDLSLPNKYTLFHSAKNKEGLIYHDELKKLAFDNASLDLVSSVTREIPDNWDGEIRRIDAEMIKEHVEDYSTRTYYLCGPSAFIDAMIALLQGLNIPATQIKREMW